MANILLLDDNPVAQKALAAILGRAEHKFAAVSTVEEALRFIIKNIEIDLLVMDIQLTSASQPLSLLKIIRANSFLKTLPVLVYTNVTGREHVREALALRVQNYLVKPYSDEKVFTEIQRASEWGWIRAHFDDPLSFCRQMGLAQDAWRMLLEDLLDQLRGVVPILRQAVEKHSFDSCEARLAALAKSSEACGFWTLYDVLNDMRGAAAKDQWIRVNSFIATISIADKFVMHMLEPGHVPDGFVDADKFGVPEARLSATSWLRDENLARRPFATRDDVMQGVSKLRSFPVFEGRAASFRLAADGHGSSVQPVIELVSSDPGLSALLIQTINHISGDPDSPIEDSAQAVQMLGGHRLREAVSEIVPIPELTFSLPPNQSSQRFWMYQMGSARVCAFVYDFMEIPIFMPHAYWAGLLHDMGKKALAAVYPDSFVAASQLAERNSVSLSKAYEELIGCTPQDAGAELAQLRGFPRMFVNVMRHYADPENAVEDRELTAIVAFSGALCRRYGIGSNGEPPIPPGLPLEKFPGWEILRERVFPSFDLNRFGDVMTEWSAALCLQLTGRASYVTD
ncbi:MAG TPA: HDOD domain-containing protein [Opitutales bacterium]|nr:HDOD domain-containing protein [Opitutales bacterium]